MDNAFIDTNVLLYSFDQRDSSKRQAATELISSLGRTLFTSTQVLQEFYWNATNKLKLTPSNATRVIEHLSFGHIVQVTPSLILASIDTGERYRISFWDALIIEAAVAGRCTVLYSEDLSHGQKLRGLRFQNPFV